MTADQKYEEVRREVARALAFAINKLFTVNFQVYAYQDAIQHGILIYFSDCNGPATEPSIDIELLQMISGMDESASWRECMTVYARGVARSMMHPSGSRHLVTDGFFIIRATEFLAHGGVIKTSTVVYMDEIKQVGTVPCPVFLCEGKAYAECRIAKGEDIEAWFFIHINEQTIDPVAAFSIAMERTRLVES